ncbi:hypothetical protein MSG28_003484 [Choristoneura fumiferana]|uniref:Uncharacterized protein n=1 Tax=Choristoneura fumiferana TaxID=7141 RepID=A0ACC0KFS9_CHOFU|nr:hypothetical protein MSG28_003484 [Choristoneura fumiferana]
MSYHITSRSNYTGIGSRIEWSETIIIVNSGACSWLRWHGIRSNRQDNTTRIIKVHKRGSIRNASFHHFALKRLCGCNQRLQAASSVQWARMEPPRAPQQPRTRKEQRAERTLPRLVSMCCGYVQSNNGVARFTHTDAPTETRMPLERAVRERDRYNKLRLRLFECDSDMCVFYVVVL